MSNPVGNEVIEAQGVTPGGSLSPVTEQFTLNQIAQLSGNGGTTDIISTSVTTVGNGTLTAAALLGGLIVRTGPVAAYTDTLDTAAAIVTAIGSFVVGATFFTTIKNLTGFTQTLAIGTGDVLPGSLIVGPFEEIQYFATIGGTAAVPTVTFSHLLTTAVALAPNVTSPQVTTLATNGAGTLTAAAINGGIVTRTTVAAAFIDTTDTAAAIIASNPALISKIGASFLFRYQNSSTATATITGGMGVTVSGVTAVPAGTWALYVITYTVAATLTMVGIAASGPVTNSGTFVANGATPVVVANTNITANSVVSFGLKTAGGTQSAPFMTAVTPGTGFSVAAAASNTGTYNYQISG